MPVMRCASLHVDAGRGAFGQQHGHDLPRRAVAEQLAERLLVPGDAVPLDQGDEVVLACSAPAPTCRNAGWPRGSASGRLPRLVKLQRPPPEIRIFLPTLSACSSSSTRRPRWPARERAHQAGGAAAHDDDVVAPSGSRQQRLHDPEAEHQARDRAGHRAADIERRQKMFVAFPQQHRVERKGREGRVAAQDAGGEEQSYDGRWDPSAR